MLKNTIDNLDDVEEKYQGFYSEKDGAYQLDDVLKGEDVTALKNAHERQKADRIAAEEKAKKLQEQIEATAIALAKANGNNEEAERLTQIKLDKQKAIHEQELRDAKKLNHELTIGMTRDSIAAEVYLKANAWKMTDMESRIKLSDDGRSTYLVNSIGETVTRDEFIADLRSDESMAFAIRAGNASGGGSSGQKAPHGSFDADKKFGDLTPSEQVVYLAAKKKAAR